MGLIGAGVLDLAAFEQLFYDGPHRLAGGAGLVLDLEQRELLVLTDGLAHMVPADPLPPAPARRAAPAAPAVEAGAGEHLVVGLPWKTLGAFLRIATNPRAFPDPLDADTAFQQVEEWLDAPRACIPEPTAQYRQVLGELVRTHRARGPLVIDAQLAALAIDHGVPLVSTDADFARFPELTWTDPLTGA